MKLRVSWTGEELIDPRPVITSPHKNKVTRSFITLSNRVTKTNSTKQSGEDHLDGLLGRQDMGHQAFWWLVALHPRAKKSSSDSSR